jgi:hypothetical protein
MVLISVALISHVPFIMNSPFFSDEAIYTYAGYAISRGVTPYVGITLPQPPVGYLILAAEAGLTHSNLLAIHALNFLMYLVGITLVYRILRQVSIIPQASFVGTLIYVLFPPIISNSFATPIEFVYFLSFTLMGLSFFLRGGRLSLFLAGAFLGLATLTWYPGLFELIALSGYVLLDGIVSRRPVRQLFERILALTIGALTTALILLGIVSLWWKALPQFLTQTLSLQTGLRAGFSITEKLFFLGSYLYVFYPLLLLGTVGGILTAVRGTRARNNITLFPAYWFTILFTLLVFVPKVLFFHYFVFLSPFLTYLASLPILRLRSVLSGPIRYTRAVALIGLLAAASTPAYLALGGGVRSMAPFSGSAYSNNEQAIGSFVANLTVPAQMIWTSEPSIAFYANRLIAPPNSSEWKLQGFFNDVFGGNYTDTAGFAHSGLGLVSPIQFEQAWDASVRVLVFIQGSGPIPYPDEILWNGSTGFPGVSSWVMSNYRSVARLTFYGNPYSYEVWERR